MGSYVPNTPEEQLDMLRSMGLEHFDDLFADVPQTVRLDRPLNIPQGRSEMEVLSHMENLSKQNCVFPHIFRGAGAYRHYIPAIVSSVISKEEFVTAYTPYQAEISQGLLQSIFEYQTMICELTGMDASNASVYDGATAAAEAAAMCRDRKRRTIYVSMTTPPQVLQVMETYCFGSEAELVKIPQKDGVTDLDFLKHALADDGAAACLYIHQPNYYGCLEPAAALGEVIHTAGGKLIIGCNPISLGLLKSPGEYGADIAVGEGQPLGMPLSFGGPYLGFMAARQDMARKLPGRIVGETKDSNGNRAYVLTLQAREQHIRREKASSNICSNQALCALTASVYLAAMGSEGLKQAASLCMSKAHYLQSSLKEAGLTLKYHQPFFHEFVTKGPAGSSAILLKELEGHGILGGLPLSDSELLWCATEINTKDEIQQTAHIVSACLAPFGKEDEHSL